MTDRTPTPSAIITDMHSDTPHFEHQHLHTLPPSPHSLIDREEDASFKNRRWSEEEHLLYLLFLDLNRQKLKSRLIRRSNAFFKEMASFVTSKASTQCRSYHQKYETRHKYPHRIIRQEMEKIDQAAYSRIREEYMQRNNPLAPQEIPREAVVKKEPVEVRQFECQTVIEGVSTVFYQQHTQGKDCLPQLSVQYYMRPSFSSFLPFLCPPLYPTPYIPHY